MDDTKVVTILFPGNAGDNKDPANRVIADMDEVRRLRAALQRTQPPPVATGSAGSNLEALADEFGIPMEAVAALPDEDEFLRRRRRWLLEQEKAFVEQFGLEMGDSD